jgi:hypothetical protein
MRGGNDTSLCPFCKRGQVTQRQQEIAFHQSTDKGYVFCRVTVPVSVCNQCGSMTWDAEVEAIIEEAVRQAYEKLP